MPTKLKVRGKPKLKAAVRHTMTYDRWVKTYRPIKCGENAPVDGYMFETFGEELKVVQRAYEKDPRCVWTLVTPGCCNHWYISSGYHYVDRMGYFVTEVPFEGDFLVIKY